MNDDVISISISEAKAAISAIKRESENAKTAIMKVKGSPNLVPTWKGKRRREFEDTVVEDMRRLVAASESIEGAARRIETAMIDLMRADGLKGI